MKKRYILPIIFALAGLALYMGNSQGMQKGQTSAQVKKDRGLEQRANSTMRGIPHAKTTHEREKLIKLVGTDIAQISSSGLKAAALQRLEMEKNKKSAIIAPYTPPTPSAPPAEPVVAAASAPSAHDATVAVIMGEIERIRNLPKTKDALAVSVGGTQLLIRQVPESVRSRLRKELETAVGNTDLYSAEDDNL